MFAARLCTRVAVARPLIQPLVTVQPYMVRTLHSSPAVMDESLEQAAKFIGAGWSSVSSFFYDVQIRNQSIVSDLE